MDRDGLLHDGTKLALDGEIFHIDMARPTGGRSVTVYG